MSQKVSFFIKTIIVSLLFLCVFVGNEVTQRAETTQGPPEMTQEEARQRYEDAIELAEVFRTDESFVHSFTFSAAEEEELKSLIQESI